MAAFLAGLARAFGDAGAGVAAGQTQGAELGPQIQGQQITNQLNQLELQKAQQQQRDLPAAYKALFGDKWQVMMGLGDKGLDIFMKRWLDQQDRTTQANGARAMAAEFYKVGNTKMGDAYMNQANLIESQWPVGAAGQSAGTLIDPIKQQNLLLTETLRRQTAMSNYDKAMAAWNSNNNAYQWGISSTPPGPQPQMPQMPPEPDMGGGTTPFGAPGTGFDTSPEGSKDVNDVTNSVRNILSNTKGMSPAMVDHVMREMGLPIGTAAPPPVGRTGGFPTGGAPPTGGGVVGAAAPAGGPAPSAPAPPTFGANPPALPPGIPAWVPARDRIHYASMTQLESMSADKRLAPSANKEIAWRQHNWMPTTKEKSFIDTMVKALKVADDLERLAKKLPPISAGDMITYARLYKDAGGTGVPEPWLSWFTVMGNAYWGIYGAGRADSGGGGNGVKLMQIVGDHFPTATQKFWPDTPYNGINKVREVLSDPAWSGLIAERDYIQKRAFQAENGLGATYVPPEVEDALRKHM